MHKASHLRIFASGERAFIAEKDGRFAIGGFGRVFDGIYRAPGEEDEDFSRRDRMKRVLDIERDAKVFADRYIVAAYSDRPTYRPGQKVQFKLLVRRLKPSEKPEETRFRAGDFDVSSALEVPEKNEMIQYSLLDSRGRAVSEGRLALNDFGTAAGSCALNSEAGTGLYSLKVRVGGEYRLVPGFFAVQHYRRPNFELKVTGLPREPGDFKELKLQLEGSYYFGKPVSGGIVELHLFNGEPGASMYKQIQLDGAGKAYHTLKIPSALRTGKYQLIATLRDESGRTIQQALPLQIQRPNDTAPAFADVPGFIPVNQVLTIGTSAKEVAVQKQVAKAQASVVEVKNGKAAIRIAEPGWYTITAGKESTRIFAYGGEEFPTLFQEAEGDEVNQKRSRQSLGWVNLTDYAHDGIGRPAFRWTGDQSLFALFDRRQVNVRDKLKILVFLPAKDARILFTMEGTTISDYYIVDLKKTTTNYHVVEIPIRTRQLPHFYLQGRILSGTGINTDWPRREQDELKKIQLEEEGLEDPRWCRVDVVDLKAGNTPNKLRVEMNTDRKEYRPGDPVTVDVTVKDRAGVGRLAEVSLSAVDESIYTFGEDRIPELAALFNDAHPSSLFRAKTWRSAQGNRQSVLQDLQGKQLQFKQAESLQKMERAQDSLKDAVQRLELPIQSPVNLLANGPILLPIGALPLNRLRIDFRETATWQPQLPTDANGKLKTTFQLPDSLTRYRLSAVAITKESEFGSARTSISTSLPLRRNYFCPVLPWSKIASLPWG